jgi:DnaJ domain
MEKLFAGPLGVILVIAQAAFFIYLMRGLFDAVSGDDGIWRAFKTARSRPHRAAAVGPQERSQERHRERPQERPSASWQGSRGWSRSSRILETYWDVASGAMTALILEGGFDGRRLEDLSRTDLMRLHELCRGEDPEAAEFVAAYMHRRFAQADPRAGFQREERRSPPPPADGPMNRERACSVLGLAVGASDEEIHHAYRVLIMKHHPDHGGSHAQAAEINQAKDVLLG